MTTAWIGPGDGHTTPAARPAVDRVRVFGAGPALFINAYGPRP
ncbi:hypothetical protein [Nocardia sp. R7R-8]